MYKKSFAIPQNLIALTTLVLLILTTATISQTKTGIISGAVRDAVTKQPLPGANIIIEGTNIGSACDENGYYVIKNVASGSYLIDNNVGCLENK